MTGNDTACHIRLINDYEANSYLKLKVILLRAILFSPSIYLISQYYINIAPKVTSKLVAVALVDFQQLEARERHKEAAEGIPPEARWMDG
eukprot:5291332-Heterocapsa_arctica.AAC.1